MKNMLAIGAVLLFLLSIAGTAFAEQGMTTFHGRITRIDTHAGTVTVESFQPVVSPSATAGFRFLTDETTNVVVCSGSGNLRDVKVGDEVTIRYHENAGSFVAQTIAQTGYAGTTLVACK
jgi:hypothetical protein